MMGVLMRGICVAVVVLGASVNCLGQTTPTENLRNAVDSLVNPIVKAGEIPAVVVGVVTAVKIEVFSYGQFSADDPRRPDGKTEFEIGSITKVFTGTVLADMVGRGVVKLDDPVRTCL